MNFETLFDDIETNVAVLDRRLETTPELNQFNQLKLEIFDSSTYQLVAPIIGADFFGGLDENSACWFCTTFSNVRRATFALAPADDLSKLRRQDISLEQFLASSLSNSAVVFQVRGKLAERALLASVALGQLWLGEVSGKTQAVSIASLDWLKIYEFTDSGDLGDWLSR